MVVVVFAETTPVTPATVTIAPTREFTPESTGETLVTEFEPFVNVAVPVVLLAWHAGPLKMKEHFWSIERRGKTRAWKSMGGASAMVATAAPPLVFTESVPIRQSASCVESSGIAVVVVGSNHASQMWIGVPLGFVAPKRTAERTLSAFPKVIVPPARRPCSDVIPVVWSGRGVHVAAGA
jgi:hypothetical protein